MDRNRTGPALAAVASGIVAAVALTWYAHDRGYPVLELEHPIQLLPSGAFFVIGALPVALLVRERVVTPSLVAIGAISLWIRSEADPGPGDPLVGFVWISAPIAVLAMLFLAAAERRVREAVDT